MQTAFNVGHAFADRLRLAAEKGKSNFSHPLGVKPKHRKIVRTFGQVLLVLCKMQAASHDMLSWCEISFSITSSLSGPCVDIGTMSNHAGDVSIQQAL